MKKLIFILSLALLLTSCAVNTDVPEETYPTEIPSYTQETETYETVDNGIVIRELQVYTKEDLYNIRNELNSNYTLEADIVFTEEDFAEGGAFYNEGRGWEPIGDFDDPFTGIFNGNGHTISGLYINIEAEGTDDTVLAGLFGRSEGTIQNLGMLDGSITVKYTDKGVLGAVNAGGVVGNCYMISDCYNTGDVTVNVSGAGEKMFAYAGGIVGHGGNINNCYNTGNISSYLTLTTAVEDIPPADTGEEWKYGYCCSGGIAALGSGISSSYNTGTVYSEVKALNPIEGLADIAYAGGIAADTGYAEQITDCYNTGNVTAVSDRQNGTAGGITAQGTPSYISKCYNTGEIRALVKNGKNSASAVGITGGYEGSITDCYNSGAVTSTHLSPDGMAVSGGITVGMSGEIANCYNVGVISAEAAKKQIGSIVGDAFYSAPSYCYYTEGTAEGRSDFGFDAATKCTPEDMKKQETYQGFDFENVWTIDPTSEYPYPTLK